MTIPGKGGAPSGPRSYFSRVKQAREAIKERAVELIELQFRIITEAITAKDFETAAKANQFLLEHVGEDEDGIRVLDISIDKPKQIEGYVGPMVQIGLNLGGMKQLGQPSIPSTPSTPSLSLPSVQVENQETPSKPSKTSEASSPSKVIEGEEV